MLKYITAVKYRHFMTTAYLKIVGSSLREAQRHTKRVGTALKKQLPESAEVGVARYRGRKQEQDIYEIPIILGEREGAAKAVLAQLVLRGSI